MQDLTPSDRLIPSDLSGPACVRRGVNGNVKEVS